MAVSVPWPRPFCCQWDGKSKPASLPVLTFYLYLAHAHLNKLNYTKESKNLPVGIFDKHCSQYEQQVLTNSHSIEQLRFNGSALVQANKTYHIDDVLVTIDQRL